MPKPIDALPAHAAPCAADTRRGKTRKATKLPSQASTQDAALQDVCNGAAAPTQKVNSPSLTVRRVANDIYRAARDIGKMPPADHPDYPYALMVERKVRWSPRAPWSQYVVHLLRSGEPQEALNVANILRNARPDVDKAIGWPPDRFATTRAAVHRYLSYMYRRQADQAGPDQVAQKKLSEDHACFAAFDHRFAIVTGNYTAWETISMAVKILQDARAHNAALQAFNDAVHMAEPDAHVCGLIGVSASEGGNLALAACALRMAFKVGPEEPSVRGLRWSLGQACEKVEDYLEAAAAYKVCADEGHPEARARQAWALAAAGQHEEAAYVAGQALNTPCSLESLRALTQTILELRHPILAHTLRLQLKPTAPYADLWYDFARACVDLHQQDVAADALQCVLDAQPGYPGAAAEMADLLESLGRLPEAAATIAKAAAKSHDLALHQTHLRLREALGDSAGAAQALQGMAQAQPLDVGQLSRLGRLLLESNQPAAAIRILRQAIQKRAGNPRLHGNSAGLYVRLARACLAADRAFATADDALSHALCLDSQSCEPALLLAALRRRQGKPPGIVIEAYLLALSRDSTSVPALLGLAQAHVQWLDAQSFGKDTLAPMLQRQDSLANFIHIAEQAHHTQTPVYRHAAYIKAQSAAFPTAGPASLVPDLRLMVLELEAMGAATRRLPGAPAPQPRPTPHSESTRERSLARLPAPQAGRESIVSAPHAEAPSRRVMLADGKAGDFEGLNWDGYPTVRVDGALRPAAWNDAMRAQWESVRGNCLDGIPSAQIHEDLPTALTQRLAQVMATVVVGCATVETFAQRVCGTDDPDDEPSPHQYFLVGGTLRDLIRNPQASVRDIDLLTTVPPAVAMRRAWSVDRTARTEYGPSGMSAPYQSFIWGTTSYGMLDITSIAVAGTLDAPVVMPGGHMREPPISFGFNLAQNGQTRDLTCNCLAYCPQTQRLIEMVPQALHDAQNNILRPASALAADNSMLALRALKFLRRGARLADALPFISNAERFWPNITKLSHDLVRLSGTQVRTEADLERWLHDWGTSATQHGLGKVWAQYVGGDRAPLVRAAFVARCAYLRRPLTA